MTTIQRNPGKPLYTKTELGEVYADFEHLVAAGYSGKRGKPDFNYRFKTKEQLEEHVKKYLRDLEEQAAAKAGYKALAKTCATKFREALAPGGILYGSWGYEQTNVEFYEILSVKGSKVTLVELNHKPEASGDDKWGDRGKCLPSTRSGKPPVTVTVRGSSVKISSYIHLGIWDGQAKYWSSYA